MMLDQRGATVLIVSDDAELGALVALNLRLRGFFVEHTDLVLALTPRWSPSFGHPDLLIVNVESAERVSPTDLRRLVERPWAQGAPLLVASENPAWLAREVHRPLTTVLARPDDVGAILLATRALLAETSAQTSACYTLANRIEAS